MMRRRCDRLLPKVSRAIVAGLWLLAATLLPGLASAFTLDVVDGSGAPVTGFRYLVEEDNTDQPTLPGNGVTAKLDGVSLAIHKSYAPLAASGREDTATATINLPADKRYFVSVLPYADHTNSGTAVPVGATAVTVTVDVLPIPTAQISILAFVDHSPVNNVPDLGEVGLGGCSVQLADAGGRLSADAFGNPLGTQYQFDAVSGQPVFDVDGNPIVTVLGNGTITTLTLADYCAAKGLEPDPTTNACSAIALVGGPDPTRNPYDILVGEALVKYLVPGKYGVILVPPRVDDNLATMEWSQTATIEGTPTVDAWVKANEPKLFVEGFGTGFNHAFFGFVKTAPTEPSPFRGQTISALGWQATTGGLPNVDRTAATGSISGTLRLNHFSKPPNLQGYFAGEPIPDAWVGLNDLATGQGLYAAPADPATGAFTISNVLPGTYQLVNWDTALDYLFGIQTVTVPADTAVALGDVLVFRWFGNFEGAVYLDDNRNGIRDLGEIGIPGQAVNLRFRDGSIYQQTVSTPPEGEYSLSEVFPFFKWLITEVDFARFKATGATNVVDDGGDPVGVDLGLGPRGVGKLTPQPQRLADGAPTEGAPYRTVTGEVLTQAMHLFLGQTNMIDWGKAEYQPGENGGISGVVYYSVTRAEDDPSQGAAEPWEPGIPRVVLNLYRDFTADRVIDDLNGDGMPTRADADNFPFQWAPVHSTLDNGAPNPDWTGVKGAEDVDRDGDGVWDPGDAIQTAVSDSFDDAPPSGCIQTLATIRGEQVPECADAFGTWNQIRDGVFNGGYAFASYYPGGIISGSQPVEGLPTSSYIVEMVTPPLYELVKEEDKNVDFGLTFTPSTQVLPAICVGDPHLVPANLSFNTVDGVTPLPGVDPAELVPAFYAGQERPLCDLKQIAGTEAKNAAVDFFIFTQVPKAARAVGFSNNDLGAEFNQASPNFGEKLAPSWIPVSFHDWAGRELTRVYTDEFGGYNALVPSTFTINAPSPSGVSPQMLTLILNNPVMPDGTPDPYYNSTYSVTPWTLNYDVAKTSYLDTPLVPLAAFAVSETLLDTNAPDGTPMIGSVAGPEPEKGALICTDRANGRTVTLMSAGQVQMINPAYDPAVAGSQYLITRDYGFGDVVGQVVLDGTALTLLSWTPDKIVATVPAAVVSGTYRLTVSRGDNGRATQVGASFFITACGAGTVWTALEDLTPGSHPIQDAIDAAAAGDLILVGPGTFNENVIMYKPVRLQGAGIGDTFINANPATAELLAAWHTRIDGLGGADVAALIGANPFVENEAPGIVVFGETLFIDPVDPLVTATLDPGNPFTTPGQAKIDGFTISGSKAGGGIHVFSGAHELMISNNEVTGNQGNYAGGIAVGRTGQIDPNVGNANVVIRDNHIHKNSGIIGAGGITLNAYSNDYIVEGNVIEGNFSRAVGGGIAHVDFCDGVGVIRNNQVLFNEDFFGAALALAGDGGGIFVGSQVQLDPVTGVPVVASGSGNVTIEGNLIQGNLSGSGSGGGIRADGVNGADVTENPANTPPRPAPETDPPMWYELKIYDNVIVNNVAANAGGGISLQDTMRATIVNNTIVNNDSTATSSKAFAAGAADSTPQPAGIASGAHTALLLGQIDPVVALTEPTWSDPVLVNNIIFENRSYFTTNGGNGGLSPNPVSPYWDLGVTGMTTPTFLSPMTCLLTSLTDTQVPTHTYDATNIVATSSAATFKRPYVNAVESAIVVDEGGNNINVRFTPLTRLSGDYHLRAGSQAIDAAAATFGAGVDTLATIGLDIDNNAAEPRPNPDTLPTPAIDIGADEFYAGVATRIGVWRDGAWYLDANGNGVWDAVGDIQSKELPLTSEVPVSGNWDGVGATETGVFVQGAWYLDRNGDGVWSGGGTDTFYAAFGLATDTPVTGDWNGDGTTDVGVWRAGKWSLDANPNGVWDGVAGGDATFNFGLPTDTPLTGDWNGDGTTDVGVWRARMWYLDYNGNHVWDGVAGGDRVYTFGLATDKPLTGDWDGNGTTDIAVNRNNVWFLDNGDGVWNAATDTKYAKYGRATDAFVSGDWDGNGTSELAAYRAANKAWYLDNGDGAWNLTTGIDVVLDGFGAPTDVPVTGDWTGAGATALGVFRDGSWYLGTADTYMRGYASWNGSLIDVANASFGLATDVPVVGDWNGDGKTQLGVYRNGRWYLDADGNRTWDGFIDTTYTAFGLATDIPVAGDMDGDGVSEVGVFRPSTGMWYFDMDHTGTWGGCLAPTGTDLCLGPFGIATDAPLTGDWDGDGTAQIATYRGGKWYLDDGDGIWTGLDTTYDQFGLPTDTPVTGIWP